MAIILLIAEKLFSRKLISRVDALLFVIVFKVSSFLAVPIFQHSKKRGHASHKCLATNLRTLIRLLSTSSFL